MQKIDYILKNKYSQLDFQEIAQRDANQRLFQGIEGSRSIMTYK